MRADFGQDVQRYRPALKGWRLLLYPPVWILFWYRLGRWLYHEGRGPFRTLLKPFYFAGQLFLEFFTQNVIPPGARIGPGLMIGHVGGIRIHPDVTMGPQCSIAHNVTIGTSAMGRPGVPHLGAGVYIGAGATVVGRIRIGDGVKIAANSLVMSNIPAGATVMGVPARIIMSAQAPAETKS